MQVHAAVLRRALRSGRFGILMERPVPRLPVIDAAAFQNGQDVDHGPPRRRHQKGPLHELLRRQLTALPDLPRRVDDEIAPIRAVDENQPPRRQDDRAAAAREELTLHTPRSIGGGSAAQQTDEPTFPDETRHSTERCQRANGRQTAAVPAAFGLVSRLLHLRHT